MPKKRLRIVPVRKHFNSTAVALGVSAVVIGAFVAVQSLTASTQRFINPATGTDSGQCTDIVLPCKTFQYTASVAAPGDVLNVRGGTYNATSTSTFTIHDIPGSLGQRTVLQAYPGEIVVLDGTGVAYSDTQALLQLSNVDNFEVSGFEIRNSSGRGIAYNEAQNIRIANNKVHDVYSRAVGGWADGAIIEYNEIWNSSLANQGNACTTGNCSGWPGVIQTASRYGSGPPQETAKNTIIRNNYVHDNWGEGILPVYADGIQILHNIVANNYSVNIYLSHTKNATIDGNYIYVNSNVFNKGGRHANGITLASESDNATSPMQKSENIRITNNIIAGTYKAVNWWNSGITNSVNSYSNLEIYHNTIHAITNYTFQADTVTTGDPPGAVTVKNNILAVGTAGPYQIGNLSAWTFSGNVWVPAKPSASNFAGDNQLASVPYVSPVIGADPHGFSLSSQLPFTGTQTDVTLDYFQAPRSVGEPTVGAIEYGVSVTPAPSLTPTVPSTPTETPTNTPGPTATPTPAADLVPPAITITSPANGSTLPRTGSVTIRAAATDASGIASISIYVDSIKKATCTNATSCSYNQNVSKLNAGTHTITATATDKSPNANSATTTISVTKQGTSGAKGNQP